MTCQQLIVLGLSNTFFKITMTSAAFVCLSTCSGSQDDIEKQSAAETVKEEILFITLKNRAEKECREDILVTHQRPVVAQSRSALAACCFIF